MSSIMIIDVEGFPLQVPMTIIKNGKRTVEHIYFDDIVYNATQIALMNKVDKVLLFGSRQVLDEIADTARIALNTKFAENNIEIEVIEQ